MRLCVRSIRARVVPITPITGPALTSGPTPPARHRARVELHRTAIQWRLELHPPRRPIPAGMRVSSPCRATACPRTGPRRWEAPRPSVRHVSLLNAASCEPGASKLTNTGPSSRARLRPFRRRRRRRLLFHALAFHPRATDRADLTLRQLPGQRRDVRGPGAGRGSTTTRRTAAQTLGSPPAAADC